MVGLSRVRWLGPPTHPVHLHGHGMIAPDEIVNMVDDLAQRVIEDGRAVLASEEKDLKKRTRQGARAAVEEAAITALDKEIQELSE